MRHQLECLTSVMTLVIVALKSCSASEYQMSYDGIVKPSVVLDHASNPRNQNPMELPQSRLIPPTIAEETTSSLGSEFLSFWLDHKYALGEKTVFAGRQIPMGLNCFPNENHEGLTIGTTCVMDHHSPGFSFNLLVTVYQPEGSFTDYFPAATEQAEPLSSDIVPVAFRLDATITAASSSGTDTKFARNVLVQAVPLINVKIGATAVPIPVWTIQERPSPLQLSKRLGAINVGQLHDPASLDHMILSNSNLLGRVPVVTSSSKILKSKKPVNNDLHEKNSSSGLTKADEKTVHPNVDIWRYQEVNSKAPTRALFLNSTLRAITTNTGRAHAEAFVHPALLAHVFPTRVAVISESPLAYISEILKYKSVEHITVAGADLAALELTRTYMPQLDDCRHIEGVSDFCMDDESVEIIKDDLSTWLNLMVEEASTLDEDEEEGDSENGNSENEDNGLYSMHPQFDIILLDIPATSKSEFEFEWFSKAFHLRLQKLMTSESIIVVNAGSSPSIDRDFQTGSDFESRDSFLSDATKNNTLPHDGIGYMLATVYDEPLAAPLDTAFIALFLDYSEAFYRFGRSSDVAIDIDIITRFSPQTSPPTLVYDGPTHLRYVIPSRAWEYWYCQTSPGKDMPICKEFIHQWYDASYHVFETEVRHDPVKGRSLHAAKDIYKGQFVLSDDTANSLNLDYFQWEALEEFINTFPDANLYKEFRDFVVAYGFQTETFNFGGWGVSIASNNTFTNHACNEEDVVITPIDFPDIDENNEMTHIGFSPMITRRPELMNQLVVARRDIKKGEEIMMDYHTFRSESDSDFNEFLVNMCNGGGGLIPVDNKIESDDSVINDEL